ncbi:hypothetical protein SVI_3068 [Shewanella violacea DSS12]|uniref:Uncharacterized protein n=1 Tax=Shewanella violacea (strain JCM 10179 / CIP 106290 / LMG 19151 / DSS12) TaxID=637905 RepID=D4ZAJ4_SHEVD|nr:hypothetical protein SVI_3068 [Shewanella violacea DSS12]
MASPLVDRFLTEYQKPAELISQLFSSESIWLFNRINLSANKTGIRLRKRPQIYRFLPLNR